MNVTIRSTALVEALEIAAAQRFTTREQMARDAALRGLISMNEKNLVSLPRSLFSQAVRDFTFERTTAAMSAIPELVRNQPPHIQDFVRIKKYS
jgi:hypothetical protein